MPSYSAELIEQLSEINKSIVSLTKEISSRSFWNSQLFAAIIGASAAILVFIITQIIQYCRKSAERHEEYCLWLTKNYIFYRPESLLKEAKHTGYGGTTTNPFTGQKKVTPDKPLGEKMIIELRRGTKYWRKSSLKIKRKFKKYEEKLLKFNTAKNKSELIECLESANTIFEEIKTMAFKHTGENQWTA